MEGSKVNMVCKLLTDWISKYKEVARDEEEEQSTSAVNSPFRDSRFLEFVRKIILQHLGNSANTEL